jgi:hypothetical protein
MGLGQSSWWGVWIGHECSACTRLAIWEHDRSCADEAEEDEEGERRCWPHRDVLLCGMI